MGATSFSQDFTATGFVSSQQFTSGNGKAPEEAWEHAAQVAENTRNAGIWTQKEDQRETGAITVEV